MIRFSEEPHEVMLRMIHQMLPDANLRVMHANEDGQPTDAPQASRGMSVREHAVLLDTCHCTTLEPEEGGIDYTVIAYDSIESPLLILSGLIPLASYPVMLAWAVTDALEMIKADDSEMYDTVEAEQSCVRLIAAFKEEWLRLGRVWNDAWDIEPSKPGGMFNA